MNANPLADLTTAEKLQLMEDLWEDLSSRPDDVPVQDWQIEEADRRRAKLQENPVSAISWEDLKARVRARLPKR